MFSDSILEEMCQEKNIYLIERSRNIKSHHLKLHLNKKGPIVLSNTFIKEIYIVFNRQFKNNSNRNFEQCNSDKFLW